MQSHASRVGGDHSAGRQGAAISCLGPHAPRSRPASPIPVLPRTTACSASLPAAVWWGLGHATTMAGAEQGMLLSRVSLAWPGAMWVRKPRSPASQPSSRLSGGVVAVWGFAGAGGDGPGSCRHALPLPPPPVAATSGRRGRSGPGVDNLGTPIPIPPFSPWCAWRGSC